MTTTLPLEGSTDELRTRISGEVVTRSDPRFDELRVGFNLGFMHNPALIVIPRSAADVSAAVRHAADHRLPVAVQTTGHGVARLADGAMLVLTRELDSVSIDAGSATARIGSGAKWEKVLGPATEAGLAPLLGSTPDVGAVGYTLGGGMGWMARKYGLSADHVRALEIVTADGTIRRTDPDNDPDLFWALRGGGAGSLGIVTAMEIDLVPLTSLYAGNLLYPAAMAREVAARYRDWIADAPDELTSSIVFMKFPPLEEVPEPLRGNSFIIVRGAFIGSDEDGEELLSHWREWLPPAIDMWGRMPFNQVALISNDPVDPMFGGATSEWFDTIDDGAVDVLARRLFEQDGPSLLVLAEIRHAGGAVSRAPEHPNSYGNRNRQHVLEMVGVTMTAAQTAELHAEFEAVQEELAPYVAGGAYLNFLEGAEKVRRTAEGFEPESWQRLTDVKRRYDPNNVFSHGIAVG